MKYYPIFLTVERQSALVIGGGVVAERKVAMLLRCRARVRVVSPEATRRLAAWARQGKIRWARRAYRTGDLAGAFLAIAATDERRVNQRIAREAARRRVLLNVVDKPEFCTFIAPSIVQRGPLTIAISTAGASPALAKRIRRELESQFGPAYATLTRWLQAVRPQVLKRLPGVKARKRFFERIVSSPILTLLNQGRRRQARARFNAFLRRLL